MPRRRCYVRIALVSLVLTLAAGAALAVDVIEGPTLTMNPTGHTPLAGLVELTTDTPTRVTLKVSDGIDRWKVEFPDAQTEHALPLLGLKPDSAYTVELSFRPGGRFKGSLLAVTGSLPADFPAVEAEVSNPKRMEPGFTLLDCFTRNGGDSRPAYTIIVNEAGDVVWYSTRCGGAVRQAANGNLWFRRGSNVVELDMLGNETILAVLQDPGASLHHDLYRTVLGTYLSLSRETVVVEDFPTSETDPDAPRQTADVRDEPVMEFLADGTLVRKWLLTDIIDPLRIGYDSLNLRAQGYDWAHDNAVIEDPSDGGLIVSIRHQDAVIKFTRTGQLVWILGPHDNWTQEFEPYLLQPVGNDFAWQYHQHAPMFTTDGTLLLFDNGNYRASPFDGNPKMPDAESYSRAVEYVIDEAAMEVRQVWQYGDGNGSHTHFARFISDADWMPRTGNVLIDFGGTTYTDGVLASDLGYGNIYTRIVEVDHGVNPREVFDLKVYDLEGGRIATYRAERIPSLYGSDVTVSK